jgi:type II secretory pathway pseudopilin PulG
VSTWEIVALVVVVVVALFFLGGLAGARARDRRRAPAFEENVRAADEALERARAADRGWHRESMEAAARAAIGDSRPGWSIDELQLVLVDDRPGIEEDRAHFLASGTDGEARIVLARDGDTWIAESVD